MASDHVIALSHIIVVGGLTLVALVGRRLARGTTARVRSEDASQRGHPLRSSLRFIARLLRGLTRLALGLGLALVTPIGLLCANGRYPLVAPVFAPFEARLATLGHRTAHARCFPLLAWHVWLVRCAGCRRRSFFREVPALGGAGVELKALGSSPWRARRCPAEYLTARPAQVTRSAQPVRPLRRRVHPAQPAPAGRPTSATDKSA